MRNNSIRRTNLGVVDDVGGEDDEKEFGDASILDGLNDDALASTVDSFASVTLAASS